jgi:NAD(P)-dependent dehydrogenase (short-subunit alcohol dehydrogenase family)
MNLQIRDKLALVTGSTHGIGRAISEALLAEGAHVIVNGRNQASVNDAVTALSSSGIAHGVAADLATAAGAQALLDAAARIGPVDILINNVGYFEVKPFADITDRDWTDMF